MRARRHVCGAIDEWWSRRGVGRSARPECPMLEMRISCALPSTVIIHRLFFQSHHEASCISPVPATPANIHSPSSWCFAASDARTASANARPFQSAIVELLRRERLGAPFCRSCKLASASVLKETRELSSLSSRQQRRGLGSIQNNTFPCGTFASARISTCLGMKMHES